MTELKSSPFSQPKLFIFQSTSLLPIEKSIFLGTKSDALDKVEISFSFSSGFLVTKPQDAALNMTIMIISHKAVNPFGLFLYIFCIC